MNRVTLHAPSRTDLDDLLAFELANRRFFESHINARPAAYYSRDGVAAAIDAAAHDAEQDRAYQFLVRDAGGALVGRVNLTRVRREHFHSAELGYRIGEAHNGKGHAKQAVGMALDKAWRELALVRVEATAHAENPGSIRVLLSNGFLQFGRSTRSFQLRGTWHDLLHFERRADDEPAPGHGAAT